MSRRLLVALAALVVVFLAALAGVFAFAQQEYARDQQQLRWRLSMVADSRAQALEHWLDQQRAVLLGLVNNESLQVYLSVLRMQAEAPERHTDGMHTDDGEELSFLRTLLEVTAQRGGFVSRVEGGPVRANVKRLGLAGLALLAPDGGGLVASSGMPPISAELAAFIAETPLTEPGFLDLRRDAQGQLALGWLLPVLSEQVRGQGTTVVARLLALRPADTAFFATLKQPGQTSATAETYLIRQNGNTLEFLSPLANGTSALSHRLAVGDEGSVETAALRKPGAFHSGLDYSATPVFAVSRQIPGTPWVLVHQVDQEEALAQSNRRLITLISVMLALLIGFVAIILFAWRYGSSARIEQVARQYQASSQRFEALSRFLDAVSDTQPHAVFATDAQSRLTFANRRTSELTGIPRPELTGRSLIGVLGQERGRFYQALIQRTYEQQQELIVTRHFHSLPDQSLLGLFGFSPGTAQSQALDAADHPAPSFEDSEHVWRSNHYPLPRGTLHAAVVLTTIEDLTELTEERRRRERNTLQLIDTLVGLMDERDPNSANQSLFVALVAREIATELALSSLLIKTAEQAGRLVNIGKIRVPSDVLTKQGPLNEAERALVQDALDQGPSLLKHLEFEGPVIETLTQINEHWDGGGRPLGLVGESILPTAQIVAVANTFVALISARAFRVGQSFQQAESELLADAGRRFDRRVVLSLLNFLNNKGGRARWATMAQDEPWS
ncbi:MAG: PAS domain-containing protein [Chromatiaceae bacterium]|nr:PAS domain-containing protein [Chromatiaceae bacterium]